MNEFGFTGRYLDKETGLWYFRSRSYSATLGRFLNRMPWLTDGNSLWMYNYSPEVMEDEWLEIFGAEMAGGFGSYFQGRMGLYDFMSQNPANTVEPYSLGKLISELGKRLFKPKPPVINPPPPATPVKPPSTRPVKEALEECKVDQKELADKLGWGKDGKVKDPKDIPKKDLDDLGLDKSKLEKLRDAYREEKLRNPNNPSAEQRANQLDQIIGNQ